MYVALLSSLTVAFFKHKATHQIPSIENRTTVFHLLYKYPTVPKRMYFHGITLWNLKLSPGYLFWIWWQFINIAHWSGQTWGKAELRLKSSEDNSGTRRKSISCLTTQAIWFGKAGNTGGRNLPVLRWIMHLLQELIYDLVFLIMQVSSWGPMTLSLRQTSSSFHRN